MRGCKAMAKGRVWEGDTFYHLILCHLEENRNSHEGILWHFWVITFLQASVPPADFCVK